MRSSYQIYNDVVERLGEYRRQLGATQQEMGRYLAVTQPHYLKLERGLKKISRRSLDAFQAAGMDVLWLLTGKHAENGELDHYLNKVDDAVRKKAILEPAIWITKEGTRMCNFEFEPSLQKAYELMKVTELDEKFIWLKIRKVEKLTQIQMSEVLDINIKRYRKVEKGLIQEDAEILASLYENLNYSPMLIMDRKRYCHDELNRIFERFPEAVKNNVREYMESSLEIVESEDGSCVDQKEQLKNDWNL